MREGCITFVIPVLNEAEYIGACIEAIWRLKLPPAVSKLEVVVVDSGSTDKTAEIAVGLGAHVLHVPRRTISASRNEGARRAQGPWIAFVDADCALPVDWLVLASKHWEDNALAAFGTPVARPPSGAPWVERAWFHLGHPRHDGGWMEVDWLPSFNLLVRREVFERVGRFDESLRTCEDSDLGYRLRKAGRLVLDARCGTRHFRESKSVYELYRREAWRGGGSWRGFLSHPFNLSELPSLVGPLVYVGLLIVAATAPMACILRPSMFVVAAVALVLSQTLPLLFMVRHGTFRHAVVTWAQAWVLANIYFLARGLSAFHSFSRQT